MDQFLLRKTVMLFLYDQFKFMPNAPVELSHISENCKIEPKDLNWNMAYLEKCRFIEFGRSYESHPYIASFAILTETGIDTIENQVKFDEKFPNTAAKNTTVSED